MSNHSRRSAGLDVNSAPLLVLEELRVRLGGRLILDNLNASLGGRVVGLLGPNGAGKTTLLRVLLGFFKPESGSAEVMGHSLDTAGKALRSAVGYMPEDDAHVGGMTAVRWIRMLAELSGLPPHTALERAHETLTFVGLGEARYRKVGTFSTGMKQKVKLAQALVHGPSLLLLDEPTNGLDPPARQRMLDLIQEIGRAGETRILISSHLLGDVERVCDEVLILKGGRVAGVCDLAADHRAHRNFVEIELTSPMPAFAEALVAAGCSVEHRSDTRMQAELGANMDVRELYRIAKNHNAALRRMEHKRDSLQEIFLTALEADDGGS
jgi:ABC-2 type transport system ATP-binding protein